jgi:hypothetical protein
LGLDAGRIALDVGRMSLLNLLLYSFEFGNEVPGGAEGRRDGERVGSSGGRVAGDLSPETVEKLCAAAALVF